MNEIPEIISQVTTTPIPFKKRVNLFIDKLFYYLPGGGLAKSWSPFFLFAFFYIIYHGGGVTVHIGEQTSDILLYDFVGNKTMFYISMYFMYESFMPLVIQKQVNKLFSLVVSPIAGKLKRKKPTDDIDYSADIKG